jgi:PPOX class probable F420-dependent enzyme
VRLDEGACWDRLRSSAHGVLGTVHAERGVDLVPVVFVVTGRQLIVPIDRVKAKADRRLRRLVNLEADSRCSLLIDHYDADWSQLWWVRAHGEATESATEPAALAALGAAFPPYRAPGAVTSLLIVTVGTVTGWAAEPTERLHGPR